MENTIIICVIAAVVAAAALSARKHFKGEGGCCGGGTYKAKSRKLKSKADEKTFIVEGMSCQHCVNRVMEAVQRFPGLSASVQLRGGVVRVAGEAAIDQDAVRAAIEKAGYTVTSIR